MTAFSLNDDHLHRRRRRRNCERHKLWNVTQTCKFIQEINETGNDGRVSLSIIEDAASQSHAMGDELNMNSANTDVASAIQL